MEPWVSIAAIIIGVNIILWSAVLYLIREQKGVEKENGR